MSTSHLWNFNENRVIMPPKKQKGAQNSTTKEPCCICCQPIVIVKDEDICCVSKFPVTVQFRVVCELIQLCTYYTYYVIKD